MTWSQEMGTSNGYIKYKIESYINSQNINGNTSNVTVRVFAYRTNTGYTSYGSGTCYCKINGVTYSAGITTSQKITNSGIYLFTWTGDIPHNGDGTKTLSMSAWINHSVFNSSEQSWDMGLTQIPRTSGISLSTTWMPLGGAVTVNINRASGSFTHRLKVNLGGLDYPFATGATTSATWQSSEADINYLASNATGGWAVIYCETWNGNQFIGMTEAWFQVYVPDHIKPNITKINITALDTAPLLQGKSRANVMVEGVYQYNATYADCSISISNGGGNYKGANATTGTLWNVGTYNVTVTLTDSRGRSDTKTSSFIVSPYEKPSTYGALIHRYSWSEEHPDENGTNLKVFYNSKAIKNNNALVTRGQWREKGGTTWREFATNDITTSTQEDDKYMYMSWKYLGSDWDVNKAYEVRFQTSDNWETVYSPIYTIATAFTLVDFKPGGRGMGGIAIGKICEVRGLEIDMDNIFIGAESLVGHRPQWLSSSTDFNNIVTVGDYWNNYNPDVDKMLNRPEAYAFYLQVREVGGIIRQQFDTYDGKRSWVRCYTDWDKVWSNWVVCYRNSGATMEYRIEDERLKTDISPLIDTQTQVTPMLEFNDRYKVLFDSLIPYSFKDISEESEMSHFGFISQDIQEGLSDANIENSAIVSEVEIADKDKEGEQSYLGIAYQEIIPLNTMMIKRNQMDIQTIIEQQRVINKSLKKIDEQQKVINSMESRLKILEDLINNK